jgi:hypothetical protein
VKIPRSDEEQAAFEALLDAVGENVPFHGSGSLKTQVTAEAIENHLLELGYVIVEVPPVNI